jgi:hypothetical protein
LLKFINEIPANTDKEKGDKDRVLDTFMAMRGMLRTQMSGPKGGSDPPREIRVMRSIKASLAERQYEQKIFKAHKGI